VTLSQVFEPQRGDLTKPRPTAWVNGTPINPRALKGRSTQSPSQLSRCQVSGARCQKLRTSDLGLFCSSLVTHHSSLFFTSHVTCHSSLPLKRANAPRHRRPGRTDSPPDSELVLNAVKEGGRRVRAGGGYRIQERAAGAMTSVNWKDGSTPGFPAPRRTEIRMPSCVPGPKRFGRQGQNNSYNVASVPLFSPCFPVLLSGFSPLSPPQFVGRVDR